MKIGHRRERLDSLLPTDTSNAQHITPPEIISACVLIKKNNYLISIRGIGRFTFESWRDLGFPLLVVLMLT